MIKKLIGNKQLELIVDAEDAWLLTKYKWYPKWNKYTYYARTFIDGKQAFLHRMLLKPEGKLQIDHKNFNGLDNQKANLRICTASQNSRCTRKLKERTSKYKGVSKIPNGKWRAIITLYGKQVPLGCFILEEEAAKAYDAKAKELFGEFAYLNFE
jgi:hypothetical protein